MLPELTLSTTAITWITALITIALGLAVKDLLNTAISGLLFYFNRNFREGDEVYLDGERAYIVRVGIRQTVFGIENGRGYTWRYIYNHRVPFLKIEKVIISKEKKHLCKELEK